MFGMLAMAFMLQKSAVAPTVPAVAPVVSVSVTTVPIIRNPVQLNNTAVTAPVPPVTTTTTTQPVNSATQVECVLTVTDNLDNAMTYSPGDADANGSCAAYPGSTPESESVTYG